MIKFSYSTTRRTAADGSYHSHTKQNFSEERLGPGASRRAGGTERVGSIYDLPGVRAAVGGSVHEQKLHER